MKNSLSTFLRPFGLNSILAVACALALFVTRPAHAEHLSQNDISILMPLPMHPSDDHLLRATDKGRFGELLPHDLFNELPGLTPVDPSGAYDELRVISIRIDPCFAKAPPATGCLTQVRMVWQPLRADGPNGELSAVDAGVHVFYNLPGADFHTLITQLEALKTKYGRTVHDEVLTVNPMLKNSGLTSAYAKDLFAILLSQVGASRIGQITSMAVGVHANFWTFGGFIVDQGRTSVLPIARVSGDSQLFMNNVVFPGIGFAGGIGPAPKGQDTFNLLTGRSAEIRPSDQDQVIEETMATFRVQNPTRHNAQTIDCVSCHTAQMAQLFALSEFKGLQLDIKAAPFKYKSNFNISNSSPYPQNTTALHNFGYKDRDAYINQRTINETADILEKLYGTP